VGLSLLKLLKESQTTYAYRGSDHEDDDGSKSKFGSSGYYPGKYFYVGEKALENAKGYGQYGTRVDITNAKLYPITYKNQDAIESEARRNGFFEYSGGYNVVNYLKSLGYDGIIRGTSEVVLFDYQKFNPQKISSLSESTITESYESQRELEWVVEDVLSIIAYNFLNNAENDRLPSIHLNRLISETDKPYAVTKKFIGASFTRIKFTLTNNINKKGEAIQRGPGESFLITVFFTEKEYKVLNEIKYSDDDSALKFRLLKKYMDNFFGSTLLHELQHAYDGFISKGKALIDKKQMRTDDRREELMLKSKRSELTPEEIKELDKSYNDYLRYTHEINARFAQVIKVLGFVETVYGDSPYEDFGKKLVEWDRVMTQFRYLFSGWDIMSGKMKKRLMGRLYKIYNRVKDEFDKTYG